MPTYSACPNTTPGAKQKNIVIAQEKKKINMFRELNMRLGRLFCFQKKALTCVRVERDRVGTTGPRGGVRPLLTT